MYNITPAATNRGRKKRLAEVEKVVEESDSMDISTEEEKGNDSGEVEEPDVSESSSKQLIESLKKMSSSSKSASVRQMLRLTLDERVGKLQNIPEKGRFQELQKMFPVFQKSEFVIYNMIIQLPDKNTCIEELMSRVVELADSILDYVSSKGDLKFSRSLLKTDDQKVVAAYSRLPIVITSKTGSQKPPLTSSLMHVAKVEDTWQNVAKEHKSQADGSFWVMAQKIGDKMAFILFNKEEVLLKCSSAAEAILSLMGAYYTAEVPYPCNVNGSLLFIQQKVLQDLVHEKDLATLTKAMKSYQTFLDAMPEENIF